MKSSLTGRTGKTIPVSRIANRSHTGIFFKHTSDWEKGGAMDFPHRDDYYMLGILREGEMAAVIDFRRITLGCGEGLVIVPGQVHFPDAAASHPVGWGLFISPDLISESYRRQLDSFALHTTPVKFDEVTLDDVIRLFEMMRRHEDNSEFTRIAVSAIVSLFCSRLTTGYSTGGNRYASLTLRFRHLLDKSLAEEKRPGAYASMLHVSETYLNEAVRAVTGLSVGAYIRARVVLAAKRELVYTRGSVSQIAASLGYDDYSYFSRLFRKETGQPPTEFRKNRGLSYIHPDDAISSHT